MPAEATSHLEEATIGMKIEGKASTGDTKQCEPCQLSKAHRIISSCLDKEDPADTPLARVAFDLIHFDEGYNGDSGSATFNAAISQWILSTLIPKSHKHSTLLKNSPTWLSFNTVTKFDTFGLTESMLLTTS